MARQKYVSVSLQKRVNSALRALREEGLEWDNLRASWTSDVILILLKEYLKNNTNLELKDMITHILSNEEEYNGVISDFKKHYNKIK